MFQETGLNRQEMTNHGGPSDAGKELMNVVGVNPKIDLSDVNLIFLDFGIALIHSVDGVVNHSGPARSRMKFATAGMLSGYFIFPARNP